MGLAGVLWKKKKRKWLIFNTYSKNISSFYLYAYRLTVQSSDNIEITNGSYSKTRTICEVIETFAKIKNKKKKHLINRYLKNCTFEKCILHFNGPFRFAVGAY